MQVMVQNLRNGAVVDADSADRQSRVLNENGEKLIDRIFSQLKTVFPAADQTVFKAPDAEKKAKQQWVLAFHENGIRTVEQVVPGMRRARASDKPFWPAPGEFIKWCFEGSVETLGLPDQEAVMTEFRKFCNEKALYDDIRDFPWSHEVMYWIVPDMRLEMNERNLTQEEVRKMASEMLTTWAKKLMAGETIPEPVIRIESKVRPPSTVEQMGLSNEKTQKAGADLLARIRAKNAHKN
ncbi:P-like helicase loader [Pantoea phage PdC23]|uniref:Replication protein P n=1 Tax=Pantoea phage PdC23 TaxID=2894356 RepID=A0AAE9C7W8_9CAUD|nr:P-like helicase loader [Pantoea phage PdC23]UGC97766.1 replication protein P [Pantoea phage PdC23]